MALALLFFRSGSAHLHRYDTFKKDSADCQHCQQIWDQMKQADEQLLTRMVGHMREHLEHDQGGQRDESARKGKAA